MSDLVVAKAGGTSNRGPEELAMSLAWAEQSDIFVASAPGKLEGEGLEYKKVTDMLLEDARPAFIKTDRVPTAITAAITSRYEHCLEAVGRHSMPIGWLDGIAQRIRDAVAENDHVASMLGERLMAEVYQSQGFRLLDPTESKRELGQDPEAWKAWLSTVIARGQKYALVGNATLNYGRRETFGRGGSDTSSGLTAYGVEAAININLTDGSAKSADPRLVVPASRLKHNDHLLYVEGRELGRNGTGLVHHEAMVPLMLGNIPTVVRSTFDRTAPVTTIDNDMDRASSRTGKVIALSLMDDVVIHTVHEPGMADEVGRLADFETALKYGRISLIDSVGNGVDGQKYFVASNDSERARNVLGSMIREGTLESDSDISLITLVGFELGSRSINVAVELSSIPGLDLSDLQDRQRRPLNNEHSIRFSVETNNAPVLLDQLHAHFIERKAS